MRDSAAVDTLRNRSELVTRHTHGPFGGFAYRAALPRSSSGAARREPATRTGPRLYEGAPMFLR